MAKTKISEFSANPANNTDIDSINIAEGCAPSGINDAIRELMAQLKDWQSGTSNDPYVVGSSGSLTLNQGTANGVPYLNGSKVVTSGSALTFDGTNLGIGTSSPTAMVDISKSSSGTSGGQYPALQVINTNTSGNSLAAVEIKGTNGSIHGQIAALNDGVRVAALSNHYLQFMTNSAERARIDSSGNLLVGSTSGSNHKIYKATGSTVLTVTSNQGADSIYVNAVGSTGANLGTGAALYVQKDTGSNRSINAGGTVNASGADYAEYMTKAGDFTVTKGSLVGINANGKLTNVFADAISFCVKSTDPSYVGGDVWGSEEALGLTKPSDDATQEAKDAFDFALEAARQTVDRIAFAGQVPVNVMGATAGQYIIPVNDNGAIRGEAVSSPTFEQYQSSVGKVIAIESDGRARIIVKVA